MFNLKMFDTTNVTDMLCSGYISDDIHRKWTEDCLNYLKTCAENELNQEFFRGFLEVLDTYYWIEQGVPF